MEWFTDLDLWLLLKINRDGANPFFDWLMPFVTDLHKNKIFLLMALPVLFGFLFWKKEKKQIALMLGTLVAGLLLTDVFCGQVLKNLIDRKRPAIEHSEVILRVPLYGNRSFPSNHAANMFCLAFLLTSFRREWAWGAYAFAFLVTYSRSYVGLHYPSDWVAGALVGTLVAWMCLKLGQRITA